MAGDKKDNVSEPRRDQAVEEGLADKPTQTLASKFAKRNVGDSVEDARARYLARKKARQVTIAPDDDDDNS